MVSHSGVISSERLLFINKDVKMMPIMKGCAGGGSAQRPPPSPRGLPGLRGSGGLWADTESRLGNPGQGSRCLYTALGEYLVSWGAKRDIWLVFFTGRG